jgi:hypothetical protein
LEAELNLAERTRRECIRALETRVFCGCVYEVKKKKIKDKNKRFIYSSLQDCHHAGRRIVH